MFMCAFSQLRFTRVSSFIFCLMYGNVNLSKFLLQNLATTLSAMVTQNEPPETLYGVLFNTLLVQEERQLSYILN